MSRYVNWTTGVVLMTAVAGAFWAGQAAGEEKVKETAKVERVYAVSYTHLRAHETL